MTRLPGRRPPASRDAPDRQFAVVVGGRPSTSRVDAPVTGRWAGRAARLIGPWPRLAELARFHTALDGRAVDHLQRLVAGWGLLADFCFADLLLFAPTVDAPRRRALRRARPGAARPPTRPSTGPTGSAPSSTRRSGRSSPGRFRLGEIIEGEITDRRRCKERVRVLCIPVRCRGEVIGVLTRESAPSFGRQPGELERTYVDIFNRFARMIASGRLPLRRRGRRDRGGARGSATA